MKLPKNSVDQSFTGENKKKQAEFLTFFEVYVFSQWNFLKFETQKFPQGKSGLAHAYY